MCLTVSDLASQQLFVLHNEEQAADNEKPCLTHYEKSGTSCLSLLDLITKFSSMRSQSAPVLIFMLITSAPVACSLQPPDSSQSPSQPGLGPVTPGPVLAQYQPSPGSVPDQSWQLSALLPVLRVSALCMTYK